MQYQHSYTYNGIMNLHLYVYLGQKRQMCVLCTNIKLFVEPKIHHSWLDFTGTNIIIIIIIQHA